MKFSFNFAPAQLQAETEKAGAAEALSPGGEAANYWCRKFGDPELDEIVEEHREWVRSGGKTGQKADLIKANFEGGDLMGAELAGANLMRANMKGADLLLADLRGACLIEADLSDANLVGTKLHEASLAGAKLATTTGLVARQLAGANLFGAKLPESIYPFEGLAKTAATAKILKGLFAAMMASCAVMWLIVATTRDAQLLKNGPAIPLPGLRNTLPILAFYLIGPMLLAGVYIAVHYFLQRLWEAAGELPAVFPDGKGLNEFLPRLLMALAPERDEAPESGQTSLFFLQKLIAKAVSYWMVPATLLLLWARYLTEQDLRGTLLQIFFLLVTMAMAGVMPGKAVGIFRPAAQVTGESDGGMPFRSWKSAGSAFVTGAFLLAVLLLSLGAIYGAPHDIERAAGYPAHDVHRLAANLFWGIGYDPFPDLTAAAISTAPAGWTGSAAELQEVRGARMDDANLRYAQAYHAFFVNAWLENADLEGAFLSQADLRGANLREADLESAVLDRAELAHTNLSLANLSRANLARADAPAADFTSATLEKAILIDAKLDGANLYGAQLQGAHLLRASMAKADLRNAVLTNAQMDRADFEGAYLDSAKLDSAKLENAKFDGAFLEDTNLGGADLRGAMFQGTILSGVDFRGADLSAADFRGALKLTAAQICSAAKRDGILLDDALAEQVSTLCGPAQQNNP